MADGRNVQYVMNKALKCPICFSHYNVTEKQPQILTCGHTFCKSCLENKLEGNAVSCSICRKQSEISAIIKNYTLFGIIEQVCADCGKEKSSKMCLHCNFHTCTSCHKRHMKLFKTDTKNKLDDLQKDIKSTESLICDYSSERDIETAATETRQKVQAHLDHIRSILTEFQLEMSEEIRHHEKNNLDKLSIWEKEVNADMMKAVSYFHDISHKYSHDFDWNMPEEEQLGTRNFCDKMYEYFWAVISFLRNITQTKDVTFCNISEDDMSNSCKFSDQYRKKVLAMTKSTIPFTKYTFEPDKMIDSLLPKHLGKIKID